jgi:hypothetical protein
VRRSELIWVVGSIINSSLFYLWFIAYGNGRNVALRDIQTFPCDVEKVSEQYGDDLRHIFVLLMKDYRAHSKIMQRRDGVRLQEFYPSHSKAVINDVDNVLAKYYGFVGEEVDYVINYDIKYRMGREEAEAEDAG